MRAILKAADAYTLIKNAWLLMATDAWLCSLAALNIWRVSTTLC
jgi:hypothetical protein